ncbi:MAG: translation initiation factor IF-6 [Candidatus Marsarchaeota archaeon]|nr:translation initiation factor IF-6 [Candidatus Marsarchaeota archaeon]MCL5105828.1 translation initiation factor IF-6 [Candidatus Marsarchaeota archaeon]
MSHIKLLINGSEYAGAFGCANDKYAFTGFLPKKTTGLISSTLGVSTIEISINSSNLVGLFAAANSSAIGVSNLISKYEFHFLKERLRENGADINVGIINSDLNSIGNNILVNDKIAFIHEEYEDTAASEIGDIFGVEVVKGSIAGFKTIGATNILTNKGFTINNNSSDAEKKRIDGLFGFDSIPTTANNGSVFIGLAAIANSKGIVIGNNTTGFELTRMIESLDLE